MATEKGLYWLALGVAAIVLVNGTQFGRQSWLGRLENRSIELVERVSGHTTPYLSLAEMRFANRSSRCVRNDVASARMQADFARVECAMARRQAAFARIQAQEVRLEAMQQMRFAMMPVNQGFVGQVPRSNGLQPDGTI